MECFPRYSHLKLQRRANRGLEQHCRRIVELATLGHFDFHSANQISADVCNSSSGKPQSFQLLAGIDLLEGLAVDIVRCKRGVEMNSRILTFDGIVCTILVNLSATDRSDYFSFVMDFGHRVLGKVFCKFGYRSLIEKFNCDRVLSECVARWQSLIDPLVFERVMLRSEGWKSADCMYGRVALAPVDGVFDFYPVAVRSDSFSIHVAFFRYLVAKSRFASQIIGLVNSFTTNPSLNESNTTVIIDRQGSRDSVQSINIGNSNPLGKSPIDVFKLLVTCFVEGFGSGHFVKISNDLFNAIAQPPTAFLRTMLSSSPTTCSTEELQSVRKYLFETLFLSIRKIRQTVFADAFAFLLRADMMVASFAVLSVLLTSAIRFALNECLRRRNFFSSSNKIKHHWLHTLLGEETNYIASNKREVKAIYRELAAGSSCRAEDCVGWETALASMVSGWDVSRDVALLQTSANGLGFVPVPLDAGMMLSMIQSTPPMSPLTGILTSLQRGQSAIMAELQAIKLRLDCESSLKDEMTDDQTDDKTEDEEIFGEIKRFVKANDL